MITIEKLLKRGYTSHPAYYPTECDQLFQKRLFSDNPDFHINFRYFDFSNFDDVSYEFQFDAECKFEINSGECVNVTYLCNGDDMEIGEVEQFYIRFYKTFCDPWNEIGGAL